MTGRPLACATCGGPITRQSKTGHCRPCTARRINADPAVQARRRAGIARHIATPGVKEALAKRLQAHLDTMSDDERRMRQEQDRWLVRDVLSRPEVRARTYAPELCCQRGRARTEALLGWCPPELRERYRHLTVSKRMPAAEARRVLEAEIVGTAEHARRAVANADLAQRLRHERDKAQAY